MRYYIVMTSSGDFEDYGTVSHFITESIEVAEAWVEKYNRILRHYAPYYRVTFEAYSGINTEYASHIQERYYTLATLHNAWFGVIEKR